jgi:succinate dehydrogenase / fumarate reductase cytochrome b subunit
MSTLSNRELPSFTKPRPLSPHLTVYSVQYTSMLSIFHRITGVVMGVYLLSLLLVVEYLILCPANLQEVWRIFQMALPVLGFLFGVLVLLFFMVLFYHVESGIRRLDLARSLSFYEKDSVASSGRKILLRAAFLTVTAVMAVFCIFHA